MAISFGSTYQRARGFRRLKSKASGRSLANPEAEVQVSIHLHLREAAQPKEVMTGTDGETLYALYVSWLAWRAYLDLRRVSDGAWVASAVAPTEGEAWAMLEKQIQTLGI